MAKITRAQQKARERNFSKMQIAGMLVQVKKMSYLGDTTTLYERSRLDLIKQSLEALMKNWQEQSAQLGMAVRK